MWHLSFPVWQFVIRGTVIYIFALVLIRLSGKREIGQMGAGEFVAILLVSNAVQNAMNGGDNSITGGLVLATVIIGLSVLIAYVSSRSPVADRIIRGQATVLIRDGKLVEGNVRRQFLSREEIQSAIEDQGADDISQVDLAVLESNGKVVVRKKREQ